MFRKIYVKMRPLSIVFLLAFCLLASSLPAMAQDSTVLTMTGEQMNTNEANAPVPAEISETELAADQGFQDMVAFDKSLSQEQRTAFASILSKHQPELEAITKELQPAQTNAGDNHLFLPSVSGGNEQTNANVNQVERASLNIVQATAKVEGIQNTIIQEFSALLSAEQKALFEKSGLAQAPQQASVSAVQTVDGTQSTSNCYYGAYYGSVATYYASWARYYGYLDRIYVGNAYSYNNWYYNYQGERYAFSGALYAGGAYALSFQRDPGTWNDTAYTQFGTARTNSYWGRYYAYSSWKAGSTSYGYYAYVNANNAYSYEGYARSNSYYCSY
jgi:hypothetical protein